MNTKNKTHLNTKKFHLIDKFQQTLDSLANYNEDFLKKKAQANKKSPCFLTPNREHYYKSPVRKFLFFILRNEFFS